MTRKECIKVLQALWRYKDCEYSEKEIRESLSMAIKALEQEQKTGRWIPISERLPEIPFGCFVTVEEDDRNGLEYFKATYGGEVCKLDDLIARF